jgi:hypothetical protein
MNKAELKKILKPLIKECIKEVVFEEGTLSTIISEVLKGSISHNVVNETKVVKTLETKSEATVRRRNVLQEQKKKMLDAIGTTSYNGVNLFEGTTPLKSGGTSSPTQPGSILEGVDPSDAGVDISQFGIFKNNMKKLMGK